MYKAVFLDRDGVLNEEIGRYVHTPEEFIIVEGIVPLLTELKKLAYRLIVVTNQAGITKGIYSHEQVQALHESFQLHSGGLIDHFYYCPYHPDYSESLGRKPNTLLFEKGLAKYDLNPAACWMIGDKERDMIPAKKLGMKTIRLLLNGFNKEDEDSIADYCFHSVKEIDANLFL